jgi:hypothetical protein
VTGLDIIDQLSLAGSPARPNEDAFGTAGAFAWVIDGATGLGDFECLGGPSDAAWLATTASASLAARIAAGETDLPGLLDGTIDDVARCFERDLVRAPEGRYQRPTASILIARFDPLGLDVAELGDCCLFARADSGALLTIGSDRAGRAAEQDAARRMIAHRATLETPEVRRLMREGRARHNTPDGYWVFGLDREAAAHARLQRLDIEAPVRALLATDGFAALVEDYRLYDAPGLLAAAGEDGLAALADELRTLERVEDPDGLSFPRFKQSDDATALLVRSEAGRP